MHGNLAYIKQIACHRQEIILQASSSEMEESSARVPEEVRERGTQTARPAAEPSFPGNVREKAIKQIKS